MHFSMQRSVVGEFLGFTVFALVLKAILDLTIWQYAGPISLIIVLVCLAAYMKRQGIGVSRLGLVQLNKARNFWLLPIQTILAFIMILATGVAVSLIGNVSGLEFMEPNHDGAASRFGDIAGNTALYLFWIAIVWVAGPAEELFFRGFMINTLSKALGKSVAATALSVLIPALIFGAGHMYYQGVRGLFTTGMIGITLGGLFLAYKRNIWPLMIAHAGANSLLFTLQYLEIDA